MGDEAPEVGYYEHGTDPPSGEGGRNDNRERHGKATAVFPNGDR
jgi:hypothetical protein